MAVQADKEELGLLASEPGVSVAAIETSPAPRRFGKRAAAVAAAVTLVAALASAVAVAVHQRGAAQGAGRAMPAGARAEKLWSDSGATYVHHVYHAPAPVYHSDAHFVTEARHDTLPVYHGDAYHGSYQGGYNNGYHQTSNSGYQYSTSYDHAQEAWWQGAGLPMAILGGILLALACVGCYYFFFPKAPPKPPAPKPAAPPPAPPPRQCPWPSTQTTRMCSS